MPFYKVYFLSLLTLIAAQTHDQNGTGKEQLPQLDFFLTLDQRKLPQSSFTAAPSPPPPPQPPANTDSLSVTNRNSSPTLTGTRPIPSDARKREILAHIGQGSQAFALEMFARFVNVIAPNFKDLIISPFAVWSLLLPLSEGAANNTLTEMRTAMRLEDDQTLIRDAFRIVKGYLSLNTSTVSVASMQALFTDLNQPVKREFQDVIELQYGADIMPINFLDPVQATHIINAEVAKATRNLLMNVILPQDLEDAKLVLMSALFFKGQWKKPFNSSLTRTEPFYDENNVNIGNVEMMTQVGNFNFTRMDNLEGYVLELPYGIENRLSMLIALPKKGVPITRVARNLQNIGISPIFEKLEADFEDFGTEDTEVFMPKFAIEKHYTLNAIMNDMGIKDLFDPYSADLSNMGSNLFVSNLMQSTRIIVDEEGTTAGAFTASVLVNKASPTKIYLNRPFLFLIIEKRTNALLFCGHVMNPNNYKY